MAMQTVTVDTRPQVDEAGQISGEAVARWYQLRLMLGGQFLPDVWRLKDRHLRHEQSGQAAHYFELDNNGLPATT